MEIERKFLVKELPNLENTIKITVIQGYLSFNPEVRVRNKNDSKYTLTVKGEGSLAREEYETNISRETFIELSKQIRGKCIVKDRHIFLLPEGSVVELDMYKNVEGLTSTVEIEFLDIEASNSFVVPDWFGQEITNDSRYKNKNLARGK